MSLPALTESTKEYLVEIRIKNNFFLKRMKAAGFETVAAFSKHVGIGGSLIGAYVNLKKAPMRKPNPAWKSSILRIAEALRCMPEDLFPPAHIGEPLKRSMAMIEVSAGEIEAFIGNTNHRVLNGEEQRAIADAHRATHAVLLELPPRLQRVLMLRFGLDGNDARTLDEVAELFGLTKESIRQMEGKALRKLKQRKYCRTGSPLHEALVTINETAGGAR